MIVTVIIGTLMLIIVIISNSNSINGLAVAFQEWASPRERKSRTPAKIHSCFVVYVWSVRAPTHWRASFGGALGSYANITEIYTKCIKRRRRLKKHNNYKPILYYTILYYSILCYYIIVHNNDNNIIIQRNIAITNINKKLPPASRRTTISPTRPRRRGRRPSASAAV